MRLIILCAAALGGMAVGDVSRLEAGRLVFAALLALVGACLSWRQPGWRLLALVACAAALGGVRASLVPVDAASALEPYVGLAVRVRGVVAQPPTVGAATARLQLDAQAVGPAGRDLPPIDATSPSAGSASPFAGSGAAARIGIVGDPSTLGRLAGGEIVVLEGRLLAGAGQYPPTILFPTLLGHWPAPRSEPAAAIATLRAAAESGIHRSLPEPQASLASGVLLGGTGGLDADFRRALQRSGLSHLVAIDGFKEVVVAAALGAVAVPLLGPRLASLPIVLGLAGYTLLAGAHPSAVRAALMVGLAIVASLSGRVADPLTSVLLAATAMAALEPRVLLDVGLQLSLSATLGIVLLWPQWRTRLAGLPRLVAEPAGLTLAVTLATLPVTLSVFELVSLVSPLAHVLAVPLLAPVLVGAALLALVSPLPALATLVGWLVWVPTTLLVSVIDWCGGLPGAALSTGRLPPGAALCLAAILLAWGLSGLPEAAALRRGWARLKTARGGWWAPATCMSLCVASAGVLELVRPDGQLHVESLAAGRGEAVLIRGPTGRTALVVGGRLDAAVLSSQVADHLAVWEHKLDSALPLDPTAEPGLSLVLARYPAEQQLEPDTDARVDLGGGAVLDVYASPDGQRTSADVSVSYGDIWLPVLGHPPPPGPVAPSGPEQPAPVSARPT